jgi:putative MATE family efflux protein
LNVVPEMPRGTPARCPGTRTGFREIIKLAFPASLEAVFQTSLGLVDQVIVGLLGAGAVAAVGLSNSVSFVIMLTYSAVGIGTGVLVAQAFGRNDIQEVSKIAAVGLMFAATCGACTAVPMVLFPAVILHWVEPQQQVVSIASRYFQLFAASAPFTVTSAVTAATFRSLNDTRTPMVITIAAVVLNTVLGYFLVLGVPPFPKLQVLGAGVAALSTQAIRCGALLAALYCLKKGLIWRWPWQCAGYNKIFRSLFKVTYPLALSEFLWGISAFAYTIVFARLGTAELASSQIVMTVENLVIAAASGLAPVAVALIGQAIGRDSLVRAKQQAGAVLRLGSLAGLLFTALLIGASFLLSIIYPNVGKEVISFAFWGLLIVAFAQPAKVLNGILGNGILPSTGDTKFVLLSHAIGSYLVGLPCAVLSSGFMGLNLWGVYGSRCAEEIIKLIFFLARFRSPKAFRKTTL